MAATKRTSTPARVTPKPKAKEPEMIEAVGEIDEDGYVDVLIFGEPFTLDTDVNGWLLLLANSGSARDIVNLVKSIIVVKPVDGETYEVTRMAEERRFNDIVGAQRHFSIEKALEFVNGLTEVSAGNEA